MIKAYISGQITSNPDYLRDFANAETMLKTKGFDVVNPAEMCRNLPSSFTHADYMAICIAALQICDYIYMIPGYEKSKGAIAELNFAQKNGIHILKIKEDKEMDYKEKIIKMFDRRRPEGSPYRGSQECGDIHCTECPFYALRNCRYLIETLSECREPKNFQKNLKSP